MPAPAGLKTTPSLLAAMRDSPAADPVSEPQGIGPFAGCGVIGAAAPGWNATAGRVGSQFAGSEAGFPTAGMAARKASTTTPAATRIPLRTTRHFNGRRERTCAERQ